MPAEFEPTLEEQELSEKYGLDDAQLWWRRQQVATLGNVAWLPEGGTGWMRFLTFFAGCFLAIRWWKVGDPLRWSPLSIFYLMLHVVLGVGVAILASFPVIWALVITGSMSLAVQMSSAWIRPEERKRIQSEILPAFPGQPSIQNSPTR